MKAPGHYLIVYPSTRIPPDGDGELTEPFAMTGRLVKMELDSGIVVPAIQVRGSREVHLLDQRAVIYDADGQVMYEPKHLKPEFWHGELWAWAAAHPEWPAILEVEEEEEVSFERFNAKIG